MEGINVEMEFFINKKEDARKISWIKEKPDNSKYHVSEHVIRAIAE